MEQTGEANIGLCYLLVLMVSCCGQLAILFLIDQKVFVAALCYFICPVHRGRRSRKRDFHAIKRISTHVLRMEDDNEDVDIDALYQDFNPRPSHGGRHVSALAAAFNRSFQSTSCAWRTTMSSVQAMTFRIISIRVLRMEDDIYPRHVQYQYYRFQPTSCAWRTTKMKKIKFYTLLISTHVLRMGDD